MTLRCRVCSCDVGVPIYEGRAPAITSLAKVVDVSTNVYVCSACGHCQSDDLPNLDTFYDTGYKISLSSDDHDQLYEVRNGIAVYRTDRQAEVVTELVKMPEGAKILDYGAAKATTLRKIVGLRPDVKPHVFDVSEDYRGHWMPWLNIEGMATYRIPENWNAAFDVVMAHYVVEHVADPVGILLQLRSLLAPGGKLFFSIPDWTQNTGDLLVADHTNHFSETSIRMAASRAGLNVEALNSHQLPSAFVVVCTLADVANVPDQQMVEKEVRQAREAGLFWQNAGHQIDKALASNGDKIVAIFGAGFYGSFIYARIGAKADIRCFLDNNQHLWSTQHFGLPVVRPADIPNDVQVVYIGLNPSKAQNIVAQTPALSRKGLELVFFE